jgi:hypothetical protein
MPTRTPDADPDHRDRTDRDRTDRDRTDRDRTDRRPADGEAAVPPSMPSLASLRDPRRRSALDLLMPPAPAPPATAPGAGPVPPAAVPPGVATRSAGSPRPPEWSDLWLLGVHVSRSVAGVPVRMVRWQLRCLRAVLGR